MNIRTRNRIAQTTAFWPFRFATYAILAAATYIFLDIGIKGSRTLFIPRAPFINVPFFTQGPQTLFVFDYEGKKNTLSDREFRAWKIAHPVEVEATSAAYSAGGVWPCIVGTALLVIGSMIFALAVGICSAIYLNEYSQNTRFIRLIRIAILNLAGEIENGDADEANETRVLAILVEVNRAANSDRERKNHGADDQQGGTDNAGPDPAGGVGRTRRLDLHRMR